MANTRSNATPKTQTQNSSPEGNGKTGALRRGAAAMQGQRTGAVLQSLRALASKKPTGNRGWQVLQQLWGIGLRDFDGAVLAHLATKPKQHQQHVLLAFATTDLGKVKNLSAFFYRFMTEQDLSQSVVCLSYLAGCCTQGLCCKFAHPPLVPGWQVLWEQWQVGFADLDYLVLDAIFQKPRAHQDRVLHYLAHSKLRNARNLSALFSSVLQQFEGSETDTGAGQPPADAPAMPPAAGGTPVPPPAGSARVPAPEFQVYSSSPRPAPAVLIPAYPLPCALQPAVLLSDPPVCPLPATTGMFAPAAIQSVGASDIGAPAVLMPEAPCPGVQAGGLCSPAVLAPQYPVPKPPNSPPVPVVLIGGAALTFIPQAATPSGAPPSPHATCAPAVLTPELQAPGAAPDQVCPEVPAPAEPQQDQPEPERASPGRWASPHDPYNAPAPLPSERLLAKRRGSESSPGRRQIHK